MASSTYSCLTTKWRLKNASNFANNVITQNDVLYLFIGRNKAWPDDSSVPIANDSVQTTEFEHWRDMIAAKKVDHTDVGLCIPKYNWESGKVFDMYRDEEDAFDDDTGAWSYTGTLNISRYGLAGVGEFDDSLAIGGFIPTATYSNVVEHFEDGIWSSESTLNTGRYGPYAIGTSTSALVFGGSSDLTTEETSSEEYNGTSWSAGGNLNTARNLHGGAGTLTAGIAIGGLLNGNPLNSTETYDGTTWSAGTSLNNTRYGLATGGNQNDCIAFGGRTTAGTQYRSSEEFDGTAWTAGGSLSSERGYLGGTAINRNHALAFGGVNSDSINLAITEEYDGINWITKDNLNTKRRLMGSAGSPSGSLAIGGIRTSQLPITEAFDKQITGVYGLIFKKFYVVTDEDKIYKCLWNNNGNPSTVKPTSTSTSEFTLADGYIWKYMYTLTTAQKLKYTSNGYMPVRTLLQDDTSLQWDVQESAVNGAIHVVEVESEGNGYDPHSGTIRGVTSSTQIVLDTSADPAPSSLDNRYVKSQFYIDSGTGAGQLRRISSYDGATKTVTLDQSLNVLPVADTSTYKISPRVIFGGDGLSANAVSNVVSNSIIGVSMVNIGSGYTQKRDFEGNTIISFTANGGSGAVAVPVISPRNGHGSDPEDELFGFNVYVYRNLDGDETGEFTINNDFRKYGLLLNPKQYNSTNDFTDTYAQQTVNLTIGTPSDTFVPDGWVTGSTSGANGIIVDYNANAGNVLRLTEIQGTFQNGEGVTQATATNVISGTISSITNPDMEKFSGDVIFASSREPVDRAADSTEEFNIIVKF